MKPMIVLIGFYGPDGASDGDTPQPVLAVVFANDESDALERVMPEIQKDYDMPEVSISETESGTAVAFGEADDGRSFSAQSVDAVLKPHLFIQILKEYGMDVDLEDSFLSWARDYPLAASRLMEVLDEKVGDVFVDDVAALRAVRPLVIAWRERGSLADSIPIEGRHRKSKSL